MCMMVGTGALHIIISMKQRSGATSTTEIWTAAHVGNASAGMAPGVGVYKMQLQHGKYSWVSCGRTRTHANRHSSSDAI